MSEGSKGWVKLYRNIFDDPDWYGKPFDKGKAWVDLLLRADHEDSQIDIQKESIHIRAGQTFTSKRRLSREWRRNYRTIDRWLNSWEMVGKIQHKSDRDKEHGYTLITINNWGKYQSNKEKDTAQSMNKVHTNKNKLNSYSYKEGSKDKMDICYLKDLPTDKQKEVEIWG